MDVWVLQHVTNLPDGEEDVKLLGVYSREEMAQLAAARLARQPGFKDAVSGFHIDRYELDKDHWAQGFLTV